MIDKISLVSASTSWTAGAPPQLTIQTLRYLVVVEPLPYRSIIADWEYELS